MLRTLRSQLIISHILPSLVIIPLMGIALVYFLETRFILPRLEKQLTNEAVVIARIARGEPQLFLDSLQAQRLLQSIDMESDTRVMIIDTAGRMVASSNSRDRSRLEQVVDHPGVKNALAGAISSHLDFSRTLQGDIVDIFAPVSGEDGQPMGVVRVSYHYTTVAEQLVELRSLILTILFAGILASALLGYILALNIDRPVQDVTQAIFDLARGARGETLPEEGPLEVKTLQRTANYLFTRLNELEQSRRQLLANLVHEVGRPIGSLRMSIQVLRSGAKDDPNVLDELLQGMEAETSLLRRLLEDLSHLHDQLIGTLELQLEPVETSEWLPMILHSWREAANQKGLVWNTDIPEGLPNLEIDSQRLSQAVGNLLANAIKYTSKGDQVSFSAGERDGMVWLRVSDSGPGIPPEELENIFKPFYRGSQKRRIIQGMGLGLSISQDIVEAHLGKLEVESKLGAGSQFTIWLPAASQAAELSTSGD
ncbi:MAG: ATP-binding protein, partial [Anaerolineales bacterium]